MMIFAVSEEGRKGEPMSELKPCPFCGSEHVVCTKPTTWQVWCTDCKCIGPWKTEREDAIEAWNRRAGEQE